jgi:hypothetical protein
MSGCVVELVDVEGFCAGRPLVDKTAVVVNYRKTCRGTVCICEESKFAVGESPNLRMPGQQGDNPALYLVWELAEQLRAGRIHSTDKGSVRLQTRI